MLTDIESFCASCLTCLRINKQGGVRQEIVCKPIISEPFEVVALDLVDPLPKGEGVQNIYLPWLARPPVVLRPYITETLELLM